MEAAKPPPYKPSPHGEGGPRQRRSGAFVCSTNAPLFPCTTICLSCYVCPIRPFGAPSPRGEGCDTRIPSSKKRRRSRLHTSLPRMGKGDRSAVDRVLSYAAQMRLSFPVLPAVFHAMSALSAPAGRLPPEGKTDDAGIASSHKTFGHRLIYICAAPPFRMSRAGKALKCAKSGTLYGLPCFCFSFPTCAII